MRGGGVMPRLHMEQVVSCHNLVKLNHNLRKDGEILLVMTQNGMKNEGGSK